MTLLRKPKGSRCISRKLSGYQIARLEFKSPNLLEEGGLVPLRFFRSNGAGTPRQAPMCFAATGLACIAV